MSTQINITLKKIINQAVKSGAARLHLEPGAKPVVRVDQKLVTLDENAVIDEEFILELAKLVLDEKKLAELEQGKSAVTTHTFEGDIRFKIHVFYQKKKLAMIFTYIPSVIVEPAAVGLTPEFVDLLDKKNGLIVIGGYHGSGRTTTVLALLNYVNTTQSKYILTLEEPIEYIIPSSQSIVEQREIGRDAADFTTALKFAKDSDIDIIFLSQVENYENLIDIFDLIAGGRLVIIVTEANSVADAVANLVDLAPEAESDKVRRELAGILLGAVVQQLIPRRGGGQIIVVEIMIANTAVAALIKEGRFSQITSVIQTSRDEGMRSLDQSLLELVKTGEVDYKNALDLAVDKTDFATVASRFRTAK